MKNNKSNISSSVIDKTKKIVNEAKSKSLIKPLKTAFVNNDANLEIHKGNKNFYK